jgi:hypothetical protein
MILRADHVAGAAFIAFGLIVIAISGSLPFGNLSSPGSGFMPMILSVLMMLLGATLVARAGESRPFATLTWSDAKHAAMVVFITALAVAGMITLGFVTTNVLMMFALLVAIERRGIVPAAAYSLAVVVTTFLLFVYVLKTPLETGPFGF